jgi:hypothetical protein
MTTLMLNALLLSGRAAGEAGGECHCNGGGFLVVPIEPTAYRPLMGK